MKTNALKLTPLFAIAIAAAGCAGTVPVDLSASGPYCYQAVTDRLKTCTKAPVPSLAVDAEVKRFEPDPRFLTMYVVRSNWADGPRFGQVQANGGPPVDTLPNTLVRMKLSPGTHSIAFDFQGQRQTQTVEGKAGDVRFVRLEGNALRWHPSFAWAAEPEAATRERARQARLVADLAVR